MSGNRGLGTRLDGLYSWTCLMIDERKEEGWKGRHGQDNLVIIQGGVMINMNQTDPMCSILVVPEHYPSQC